MLKGITGEIIFRNNMCISHKIEILNHHLSYHFNKNSKVDISLHLGR